MESILTSIKKLLGITEEYTHFDQDIIIHINTVFTTLNQLGVGPSEGFAITDDSETWSEFLGENETMLNSVKTFIYMKVKLIFDPPLSSEVIKAMDRQIKELEWRITATAGSLPKEE